MGKSNELILNGKILAACLLVKRIFSAQDSFSGNNGVSRGWNYLPHEIPEGT